MTFDEIDLFIGNLLKFKYGESSERRDYRELEKNNPTSFKGYGNKFGVMYLVDVSDDLYIDINIWKNKFRMCFRKDDDTIISATYKILDNSKDYLLAFLSLIEEYSNLMYRYSDFENGIIPIDILRNNKINQVL